MHNPEALCLETPNGHHYVVSRVCKTGRKGTLFGASHFRQTCDPTRPATFQTVSLETVWKLLRTGQPSYHQPRHRRIDERLPRGAQPLVVLAQPTVVGDPGEGALHHPPTRQHPETPRRHQPLPIHLLALPSLLFRPDLGHLLGDRLG